MIVEINIRLYEDDIWYIYNVDRDLTKKEVLNVIKDIFKEITTDNWELRYAIESDEFQKRLVEYGFEPIKPNIKIRLWGYESIKKFINENE